MLFKRPSFAANGVGTISPFDCPCLPVWGEACGLVWLVFDKIDCRFVCEQHVVEFFDSYTICYITTLSEHIGQRTSVAVYNFRFLR